MKKAVRFKHTNVPRQNGELARLKVVSGPDLGAIYVISGSPATIGRGEDSDIVISDLKASRHHARVVGSQTGWSAQDVGSANGILHNGQPTRNAPIKLNDTITVGETTLEFVTAEAGTQFLMAPAKQLAQVLGDQAALKAQKDRVLAMTSFGAGIQSGQSSGAGGMTRNRKIMYGVLGVLVLFLLFGESEPAKPKVAKKKPGAESNEARNLAAFLPKDDSKSVDQTAEMFFKAGFREYREGNYIRAKTQFETVLQMVPGHPLASLYMENCNQAIDEAVKQHLERGRIGTDSGKLREAKGHFQAVLRLLHRDQSNPAFSEAKDQLTRVEKLLKGEGT